MALALNDRVQQTGTANTTVSFTLSGSVVGFQSFAVVGNGNTTYYSSTDALGNWEAGIGTYSTTGPTLTRTTILSSSNSGSAVTFSGTVNVFVTYPSSKSVNLDGSGNVSALGTVSSGTWQGSTIAVAYGGTGVTSSSGANSVMLRDANQNVAINRLNQANTSTAAAAGTTTLTAASSYSQTLTGTGTQTYKMPDATTLTTGVAFVFNNNATGTLTLQDYSTGSIGTITAGGAVELVLLDNSTVAGTWDVHGYLPENVTWGTNALNLGSTVITNGTWNGGTIQSGYGGTGLTTFSAANNALYSTSSSALAAGTLPVAAGGTGAVTLTGYVYGNGTGAFTASTTIPTSALTGNYVSTFSGGSTGLTPSTATTGVVTLGGLLATGYGGTGLTTFTSGGAVYATSTSALTTGTLPIASGGTGQTTATTAFNALSPITTKGDLISSDGTNDVRLGVGTDAYVLVADSTATTGLKWASNPSGTTITVTDFTATASQTTFTVTYTVGLVEVYVNGVKLGIADYTATNGTSVILATGANVGDLVEVVAYTTLNTITTIASELFSGTGSQTVYTMAYNPASTASVIIAISGVVQDPSTYTVSTNTLTFSTAPPSGTNNISVRYLGLPSSIGITTFSGGTTGLTPASATSGPVTLAGTLAIANGGTGQTTANSAFNALAPSQTSNTGKYLTTDGTNSSWATVVSGATLSNDTTTASTLYPLFAAATSGVPTTLYTSNAKYLYKPSTGDLTASQHVASNGLMVNNATIATSYTIATGYNASSVGPITLSSGVSVTVPSGSRWVVL
jgi:hypothetical protein